MNQKVSTNLKKNQFFILTAIIIFVLCVDVLMVKLPVYSISDKTSGLIFGAFASILTVSIIAQLLYFRISFLKHKINFGFFTLSDTAIKSIAVIIQSIIICILLAVFIQIIVTQSYYTAFIKYTILLSTLLSMFFISLLLMRFISWYQASKSGFLLLFTISTMGLIATSILIIIFSYFALLNSVQVMYPSIPSFNNIMFNLSGLKNAYLISSTVGLALVWIASILILKPYASVIGSVRFWIIMAIPIIFFINKFQFYQYWLSNLLVNTHIVGPVSFFRFSSLFDVSTSVVAALVFGMAYWIVSGTISDRLLKQYIQISGVGICLLVLSNQITNLTLLPYPPFGLISISFAGISSYLLFIGLYQSALIISRDSIVRSLIRKSARDEVKLMDHIGTSEMSHNITSQFKQVAKRYGDEIIGDSTYETSDSEHDVKGFVEMALRERENYINNVTLEHLFKREEFPYEKSWETWVELWWQWYYSFPYEDSPALDSTGEFSQKGHFQDSIWFLAGTNVGKVERNCTIPQGTAIFCPIINDIISYHTYPELKTDSELIAYAKTDLDQTNLISASLDGLKIPNLNLYRVQSNLFQINIPDRSNKDLWIKTKAVSDGFWLFIKPLSPGRHKLEFIGEKFEFDKIKNLQKFRLEVTYHLQIV